MIFLPLIPALLLAQKSPIHFDRRHESVNVPFELNSGKIYLHAKVDHRGPYWFVLDSGSPGTVIDMSLARQLGLELKNPNQTGGAGEGSTGIAATEIKDVELQGLNYQPLVSNAIDLDTVMAGPEGRHVQGLVGGDFIARSIVEIDYAKRLVSFRDPATYHHVGKGYVVPLHLQFGFMMVDATMKLSDGRELSGRFLVDTGARLAITLNTPFVDSNHLLKESTPRVVVGSGLGGKVLHGVDRLKWLQVGDARLSAPVVTYSQDKKGVFSSGQFQGLIGSEVLQRFRVTIDYPDQKMYFDPAGPPAPFSFDASGMFLVAQGPDLRSYKVLNVAPGAAASEAGIKDGDLIETVDGKPASSLTLEQLRDLLKQAGKTVKLGILQDGKSREVILRLKRIV